LTDTLLGDAAEVVVGGTPSTKNIANWNGDIAWVTPTDITKLRGRYLAETARNISAEGLRNSSARVVPAGSVVVATRATIGPAAIASVPVATNQGVTALIPGSGVLSAWLYHWVIAHRFEFTRRGAGNTFPEISRSKTRRIPIHLPDFAEQEKVADLCEVASEVVERSQEEANSLAVALKSIREELCSRLPEHVVLGDGLVRIEAGRSPAAEDRLPSDGERAVLKVSAVKPGRFDPTEVKTLAPATKMPAKSRVNDGDVLITRANTSELVGAICQVDGEFRNLYLSDKTLRLSFNDRLEPEFAVQALSTVSARAQIRASATGTSPSMKNISQATIRELVVPSSPSLDDQRTIGSLLGAIADVRAIAEARTAELQRLVEAIRYELYMGQAKPGQSS
jgi:type I restriction enzyme S subunit